MANETLSIQKDDARLTVIGKSKADTYIDSGLGLDLDDLDIGSLDPFDLNWQTDVPGQDNLPDEIRIISPPYKTEYKYNDKVDLNGIIVKAYKNDLVWENDRYPDGLIPINELFTDKLIFRNDGEEYESDLDVTVSVMDPPGTATGSIVRWSNNQHTGEPYEQPFNNRVGPQKTNLGEIVDGQKVFGYMASGSHTLYGQVTDTYKTIYGCVAWNYAKYPAGATYSYKHNEKTVGVRSKVYLGVTDISVLDPEHNIYISSSVSYDLPMNGIDLDAQTIKELAWTAIFGESSLKITVFWERPVDKQILSASFSVSKYVGD